MILQLACQHGMGEIILRHCKQARGILVNAVDDAGALLPIDTAEPVPQGVQQAIDQGIVTVAGSRMHHQPLGLVDDQQIIVFIHNIQRDLGGGNGNLLHLGKGVGNHVSWLQAVILPGGLAVARYQPLLDAALGGAAAETLGGSCQKCIQPFPGTIRDQLHFLSSFQKSL